ncbi:MAG: Ig-like domain-containing protein [Pseudomonadota bacterium]
MLSIFHRFMFRLLAFLSPVVLLAACGGGGSGPNTLLAETPSATSSLQVTLSAAASSLNGGQDTILTVKVTDASTGKAVSGQEVTLAFGSNVSGATLSATGATTDANGVANVRYTAGALSGSDSVIASVTDSNSKTTSASLNIVVTASSATVSLSIALSAAANSLNAGENTVLTATVTDSNGKAASGQTVAFAFGSNLSGASLSASSGVSASDGLVSIRYTAGSLAGNDSIIATVTDANGSSVSASVSISVSSTSSAAALRVTLTSASSTLNGGEDSILSAVVTDASGKVVSGQTVTFAFGTNLSGASLSASSGTSDASGKVSTRYTAGSLAGTDNVIASVTDTNGKSSSSSVSITVSSSSSASTLRVALSATPGSVIANQSSVLTAVVTNADGTIASGRSVSFSFGTNLSGAALSAASGTSDASGVTMVRYTSGSSTGVDTIIASVTDDAGKTATSSVNIAVSAVQTVVGSVRILSSSNSLGTNDLTGTTIIVEVKSSSNVLLSGVPVTLTADNGSLLISNTTTDDTGTITAKLTTGGMFDNGTISLNASAGAVVAQPFPITVQGTILTLSGPTSAVTGNVASYSLSLKDSNGIGIPNHAVSLSTTSGTLSSSQVTTSTTGEASFTLNVSAAATVTASALNTSGSMDLAVSTIGVEILEPSSGALININTPTTFKARLTPASAGQSIDFASTRGTLGASSALTDAAGEASVTLSSSNSGTAEISASFGGVIAKQQVVFTAPAAEQIVLQAEPSVVDVNGSTTVTAILRDNQFNTVANKAVSFNIVADTSNGSLSQGSALTDANGRAQVTYTAGTSSTATDGVIIKATAVGTSPVVETTTTLTVAGQSLFVRIGSSNISIDMSDPRFYKQTYTIIVTDSAGLPVKDAQISPTLLPPTAGSAFYKGYWAIVATEFDPLTGAVIDKDWVQTVTASCFNEDVNQNGILDPGEDTNGNGQLDPGNIATVEGGSSDLVTDETGFATLVVKYAQNYGAWVDEVMTVTAKVVGSEGRSEFIFTLPVPGERVEDVVTYPFAPSANPSPWGKSTSCSNVD